MFKDLCIGVANKIGLGNRKICGLVWFIQFWFGQPLCGFRFFGFCFFSPCLGSMTDGEKSSLTIVIISTPSLNRLHDKTNWIIDTGCSHHVTVNESCLLNIQAIPSCPMGLLDEQIVVATKVGTVKLTDSTMLHNFLFVPELRCNSISISQVSDELHYFVQINSSLCVIQDKRSREVIGKGERRDELYYLPQSLTVQVPNSKS